MDVIDIPRFRLHTSVTEALEAMRRNQRSAGLVITDADPVIVRASQIVVAKATGGRIVSDLAIRWPVQRLGPAEARQFGINLVKPHYTSEAIETFLDRVGKLYAIPNDEPEVAMARIFTRFESLAAGIRSGPSDCYCVNPNIEEPHPYNPPPIPSGGICHCGYKIVCS